MRFFVVFESNGDTMIKKLAGYHQFHAVGSALEATISASSPEGDRRVGVVWHPQGSGKSLTRAFYTGRVVLHPAMENPTLVVITDRNDLDEQLFGTFSRCQELLRQEPEKAEDRAHLRTLLKVAAGGVVFTTIQKFLPETRGDTSGLFSLLLNKRTRTHFCGDDAGDELKLLYAITNVARNNGITATVHLAILYRVEM